jgi:hypothetical protein
MEKPWRMPPPIFMWWARMAADGTIRHSACRASCSRASAWTATRAPSMPRGIPCPPLLSGKPSKRRTALQTCCSGRPTCASSSAPDLDEASNGLNIEGLAVAGGKLFVGLRAPSLHGKAYILGVALAELFAAGHAPSVAEPEVMAVELGPPTAKLGIRDLAPFQDQLLLLAGPAQEQDDVAYSLFLVEPRAGAKPTPVASLPDLIQDGKRMKAESVTILDAQDDTLRVLIMFDGPRNGAPHEYRVSLK